MNHELSGTSPIVLIAPAGVGGIYGLYATIVPLVAYAVFGPSRILVLGPDSALAGIIAATVLPLAAGDPDRVVALAGMLSILAGAFTLLMGAARLGFLTDLLSKPIRYGYLNGIALTVLWIWMLIDAISRYVPGVLGCAESLKEDSFAQGLLEYPQYTRPPVFREMAVPEVLLSGNHAQIERWRRQEALRRTWKRRPDLLDQACLSDEDLEILAELKETLDRIQGEDQMNGDHIQSARFVVMLPAVK